MKLFFKWKQTINVTDNKSGIPSEFKNLCNNILNAKLCSNRAKHGKYKQHIEEHQRIRNWMNDKCLDKYIISVQRTTNKMKSKHRALYRYCFIHVWAAGYMHLQTVFIRFDTVKTCDELRGYRTWGQTINTTKHRDLYFRLLSGASCRASYHRVLAYSHIYD